MKAVAGRLVEIYIEDGTTFGIVKVDGMFKKALLTLILDAHVGDEIAMESGMGVSILHGRDEEGTSQVLGYSRESRRN
jgi:hydrogenase maturation factor